MHQLGKPVQYSKCTGKVLKGFHDAWTSDEPVFPVEPATVGQRWFLRTLVNPLREQDLVFIGINPSGATRFSPRFVGGDPTTEMVLRFFPLGQDGAPLKWRTMTMVNLLPLIGQPRELPDWATRTGRREILQTLPTTREVLDVVLSSSACVHLMWGKVNDPKLP